MLTMLNVLRDDLHQLINIAATSSATTPATPLECFTPLRRRFASLFDELEVSIGLPLNEKANRPPCSRR